MPEKMSLEMLTIRAALESSYDEFAALRTELFDLWGKRQPSGRPDNRDTTLRLGWIVDDLDKITAPDVNALPTALLSKEICANIRIDSKSRDVRRQNALAKLRPCLVQARKFGLSDFAAKLAKDIERGDCVIIPGPYELHI